jgi:hypothetical protein
MEYLAIQTQRQRDQILETIWRNYGDDYNDVARLLKGKRGRWLTRCVVCGEWCIAGSRKKRFCSGACRERARRGWQMNETNCIVCGKHIVSIRQRKYCHRNCRERNYRMRKAYRAVNSDY